MMLDHARRISRTGRLRRQRTSDQVIELFGGTLLPFVRDAVITGIGIAEPVLHAADSQFEIKTPKPGVDLRPGRV